MNQALAFGVLFTGGILLTKAVTGSSFADIVQGHPGTVGSTGQNLLNGGVGGVGATVAAKTTAPAGAPGAVGQVTSADLAQIGAAHGWTGSQLSDWMNVITRESGGNPNAVNKSSGAAGIAQFINGFEEYAQYGGSASTVTGQLTAMANYIAERYGTPANALAHEISAGWY